MESANTEPRPISPIIKIAPTKDEKAFNKLDAETGQGVQDYVDVLEGKKPGMVNPDFPDLTPEQEKYLPWAVVMKAKLPCLICDNPMTDDSVIGAWKIPQEKRMDVNHIFYTLCKVCQHIIGIGPMIEQKLREGVDRMKPRHQIHDKLFGK